ncbi:MAG: DUF2911 domain-containing protein, partial [Myxococcota bacterium]
MTRLFLTAALFLGAPALAQDLDMPVLSPHASVMQQIGVAEVTVDYYSPEKKGREIFGKLVPYGEMWRTGANSGTQLTSSKDFKLGGKDVKAGTYMVFTIPGEDTWTVVLNSDLKARPWAYDEKLDVVRFDVKPEKGPGRERLTFLFTDTTDRSAKLNLEWAGVRVVLPVELDTVGLVNAAIDAYSGNDTRKLADAGKFRGENGDLEGGLALVEKSLAVEETWYATFVKAELLKKKGDAKGAYKAAKKALDLG